MPIFSRYALALPGEFRIRFACPVATFPPIVPAAGKPHGTRHGPCKGGLPEHGASRKEAIVPPPVRICPASCILRAQARPVPFPSAGPDRSLRQSPFVQGRAPSWQSVPWPFAPVRFEKGLPFQFELTTISIHTDWSVKENRTEVPCRCRLFPLSCVSKWSGCTVFHLPAQPGKRTNAPSRKWGPVPAGFTAFAASAKKRSPLARDAVPCFL